MESKQTNYTLGKWNLFLWCTGPNEPNFWLKIIIIMIIIIIIIKIIVIIIIIIIIIILIIIIMISHKILSFFTDYISSNMKISFRSQ